MEMLVVELTKNKRVEIELIRKNIKNINLTIRPDFTITISANPSVPIETVLEYLAKKTTWLLNRIGKYQQTKSENVVEHEYVSGESFKYLGKQYRLLVEYTTTSERVVLADGFIKMFVREKRKTATKSRLIDEWYRENASSVFTESLQRMYSLVSEQVDEIPTIDFKIMHKRWGSCLRSRKTILLNFELIKAPKYCIDYVMLHELVHFIHKNHDSKFYETITVLMPDWKERKAILDDEIILYV